MIYRSDSIDRVDTTDSVEFALTVRDVRDLQLIVDASLDSHPMLRDVSDDDTSALSAHLATLAIAQRTPTIRLCAKDAHDLASIVLSVCVEGATCFSTLRDHEITDDRVTQLCDLIWKVVDH